MIVSHDYGYSEEDELFDDLVNAFAEMLSYNPGPLIQRLARWFG